MIKVCVLVKENDLPFSSESMSFHYNVLVIRVISCMSHVLRKPAFFAKTGANTVCGKCAAGQHLCLCYIENKTPLLP